MDIEQTWIDVQKYLVAFNNLSVVHGGISINDVNELKAMIAENAYKTNHNRDHIQICELGCWTGTSSVVLAKIAKENNGRLFSIDSFKGAEEDNLMECAKVFNIRYILENNLKQQNVRDVVEVIESTTTNAVSKFADETFDVIFIDADHRYKAIKQDIQQWLPKLKKGGILCGHDCEVLVTNGVQSIYDKWSDVDCTSYFHVGVTRALHEILPNAKKTDTGVVWYYKKY